jgi:amino acid adenylation domain-containing protein
MTQVVIPRAWIDGDACPVSDLPVHELFLQRARSDPSALAVRQWGVALTYRQLASVAGGLAQRLSAVGVGPGSRVGLCMRRTLRLPASMLAVLMAGGTFVPLDLEQPAERLHTMAGDAGIETALVDAVGAEMLTGVVGRLLTVGDAGDDVQQLPGSGQPTCAAAMDDLAYIMYTSGSTGRPKGVMVSHRNLAAFAAAINQHLGELPGHRTAAFAAIGFDVSVYEFVAPLVHGDSIHLVSEVERTDSQLLQRFLQAHRVTRVFLAPALLPLLDPGHLPHIQQLIVGGEPCDPGQVKRWAVPGGRRFYNWYGPTETTVAVIGTELSGSWDRVLPLGRPMPGSSIYILGDDMAMCPPGQAGEVYVGGPQVSLGYLSSPQENAKRFVPDPYRPSPAPGRAGVLYRTGDLAEWDGNGTIWFLGRADRQVKIHGQRVEPAEIEAVLRDHPAVAQAIVDIAESVVRAYVTSAEPPTGAELREHCAARLPRHMVPASVTVLARLPMTVNAKVDFTALRRAAGAGGHAEPAKAWEPETEFERTVTRSWAAALRVQPPGPAEDFFAAGGDSLSAMRLASELRGATGMEVSAVDIFAGRTVAGIAARLASARPCNGDGLPTGSPAALSPAQRRLWFIEQFAPGVPVHNIVMAERVKGTLDISALETAFTHVVACQAALRWQLRPLGGLPSVAVAPPAPVTLAVDDLSAAGAPARHAMLSRILEEESRTPIGLTSGRLWRARVLRLACAEHVLVITVHHIVFDGWSQAILYRELGQAYRRALAGEQAGQSAAQRVTFADYTAWVLDRATVMGPGHTGWWHRHLSGAPTVLDLPRDRPRLAVLTFRGGTCAASVDAALATAVARLAADLGTTVSAVLLATFSVLLRRLTGQREMVVGTPVADRGHPGLEDLVGFFIRTLPLRLAVDDSVSFAEHVHRCSGEMMAARQHSDAPLERIVETLGGGRDLTRNPLYQVMFNVYNFAEGRLDLGPDTTVHPVQAGVPGSLVDLTVYAIPRDEGIRMEAAYNCDLYDAARIDALLESYVHLLHHLIENPRRSIGAASARPERAPLPDWAAPLPSAVPSAPGLLEQVRARTTEAPDAVAIEEDGRVLSFRDVQRVADTTAATLGSLGVRTGDVVGVLAARTGILPPLLLGVLSVGARWAILEPELPDEAVRRRLAVVGPRVLISCGKDDAAPAGVEIPVIDGAALAATALTASAANPPAAVAAGDRGYLAFTSGTTGEPKVAETGEAPLTHFLNWYRATFGLGRDDRFALLGGLAHDPLLRDMFTPLTCGARLAVPSEGLLTDPARLAAWLADRGITVAHLTPPLVRMLAAASRPGVLGPLCLAAFSGDQLTGGDVAALRSLAPHARVLNFYGTTETPQAQACHEDRPVARAPGAVTADDAAGVAALHAMPVPVGEGIDGSQLLVMSVTGRPAAVGELGEVVIRSRHLFDGYLGEPPDSGRYARLPGAGEGRVFRTGDLGRYGPSGQVSLAGRVDDQVKVRGFRVELGEVEAALCAHPEVSQAAVRLVERDGGSALHAYVVARGIPTETALLRHAGSLLPGYAVPSAVTMLGSLPLTRNGKIDRDALPSRPRPHVRPAVDGALCGDFERLVSAVWQEVLGLHRIGSADNFFEIGGHSMAIIEVQSRLARALGRAVPVVDLFRFPTIRSLADHLASGPTDAGLLSADLRGHLRRQRSRRARGSTERVNHDAR